MEELKKDFDRFYSLTFNTWQKLKPLLQERELGKGEIFCKEGSRYKNEILVREGVVRGFCVSYTKEEVNLSFVQPHQFVTPYFYRNLKGVSTINYQALCKSKIVEFDASDFASLMRNNTDLTNFGMAIVEDELSHRIDKEISLLTLPAEDRYEYFQKQYPGLVNQIQHYHIASYLGITPISLSRIRKKSLGKQ